MLSSRQQLGCRDSENVERKNSWFHVEFLLHGDWVIVYQRGLQSRLLILSFCFDLFYTLDKMHRRRRCTEEAKWVAYSRDEKKRSAAHVSEVVLLLSGPGRGNVECLFWNLFSFPWTSYLAGSSTQSGWFHNWTTFMFLWPFLQLFTYQNSVMFSDW